MTNTSSEIYAARLAEMLEPEEARSNLANPAPWAIDYFNGGLPVRAGVEVNQTTALSAGSVFACNRNLAEDIAKLPFLVYRRLAKGKERATDQPLYRLLHDEPNPEMTAFDFRQAITGSASLLGNGYAEIERTNDGAPLYLWPIENYRVRVCRDPAGKLYYEIDGGKSRLSPADMLHLKGFGNGILGHMVLTCARESFGLTLAAEQFAGSFFGNGTRPSGVLEVTGVLSDDAHRRLRNDWANMHAGPQNAHRPAILEGGTKWNAISTPPEEAQMLESRQFQVEDVARWFRMPPHKIGHLLRATGWSTLEATNTDYVIDTLMPWSVRWEQECTRKLVAKEDTDIFAEHLFTGLLRGDTAARGIFYKTMREIGVMNADDIAELENMNPLPDDQGQVYLVPLNMGDLSKINDPPPTPPAAPVTPPPTDPAAARALIIEAHRPAFEDAAARVVRREVEVLRKKGKTVEAVEKFYADHAAYCRAQFAPLIAACTGAMDVLGGEKTTKQPIFESFKPEIEALRKAIEADSMPYLLEKWESERHKTLADEILLSLKVTL